MKERMTTREITIFDGGLVCTDCGGQLPIMVCHSAAGYYIGQVCDRCGPYSRISESYFKTFEVAMRTLADGDYRMRLHP